MSINLHSQLISSDMYTVDSGKVYLNIEDQPNGVYLVKVNVRKPIYITLIKKDGI